MKKLIHNAMKTILGNETVTLVSEGCQIRLYSS